MYGGFCLRKIVVCIYKQRILYGIRYPRVVSILPFCWGLGLPGKIKRQKDKKNAAKLPLPGRRVLFFCKLGLNNKVYPQD